MALRSVLSDPMLKLLAGAVALAAFLPVGEAGQPIATGVANAAVFVLFLLCLRPPEPLRHRRRDHQLEQVVE